jgi:hypothetical protein
MKNNTPTTTGCQGKKAYSRPALVVYGSVVALTQTGGISASDGAGTQRSGG